MPDDPKPPFNLDDIDFGPTIRGHQKGDRVFDRFVLQKLLGRGGMGVVWLALDERLGREVALKFAPEAIRFDEVAVEELKEETRKGLALAHPNIVRIYDFLLDEDHAAISMEFIDGENLGALRTRQPNKVFEAHQLTPWIAQMLDALDYAHRSAKVIHRDLKPANLMIDREGNLRVTDFGIARSISDAMDRATLGRASTGTLAYMSPQQAGGKKPHISDDIYSFGSTLYELVTGKPPFYTGNIAEQLKSEAVMPPTERRHEFSITGAEPLPAEWEDTILACLEKNVENRPATAQAVMERLGLTAPSRVGGESPGALPGAAPGFAGGPQTSHTTAYIRPGAGLTEIAAPGGKGITASRVRLASRPGLDAPLEPRSMPPPPPPPSGGKKWLAIFGAVWGIAALGAGGWFGWEYWKKNHPAQGTEIVATPPKPTTTIPDLVVEPVTVTPPVVVPVIPPAMPPVVPKQPELPATTIAAKLARAKSGDTITLEAGTYQEEIQFKEGVKLRAAENGKVFVQTNGKTGSALRIEKCASGSITGIVFQHLGSETVEGDPPPVALINSSSVTLEDCTFQKGAGTGLEITGAGRPELKGCTFSNNARAGLIIGGGSTAIVNKCIAQKNGASGIEIRHSATAPALTGNNASDNADSGITVKDGATATISENSQFNINGEAGIAAAGDGTSITVLASTFDGNKHGISIQKNALAKITGCIIRNSKEMGIHFGRAASGSELRDNTVEKSEVYGMLLSGAPGGTALVSGNKVTQNALTGILITSDGFKPTIEQNECAKNGEFGIGIAEGASAIVKGNTVRGNNLGGIGQQNAAKDVLLENNITDDAAAK